MLWDFIAIERFLFYYGTPSKFFAFILVDDSITEHQTELLYNKFNSLVQWHDSRLLAHPSIMVEASQFQFTVVKWKFASEAALNGFDFGTDAVCEENLVGVFLRCVGHT